MHGCRAMGYAQADAPIENAGMCEGPVVERAEDVLEPASDDDAA